MHLWFRSTYWYIFCGERVSRAREILAKLYDFQANFYQFSVFFINRFFSYLKSAISRVLIFVKVQKMREIAKVSTGLHARVCINKVDIVSVKKRFIKVKYLMGPNLTPALITPVSNMI